MTETQPLSFAVPAIQQCPFSTYDQLRSEAPVYVDPLTGNYVLTRYDDVRKTALNTRVFSNKNGLGNGFETPEGNAIFDARGWRPVAALISNDPPEHRRHRTLVDKAFLPAKIEALEPRIQEIIDTLIDGFIDRPEIEFVQDFAVKLTVTIIAEQLSIAVEDMDKFKRWSDNAVESMSPTLTHERHIELVTQFTEQQQYIAKAVHRLQEVPDDSLLSRLANVEIDGDRLAMDELQTVLQQLLIAGNETTTAALAAGVKLLIDTPSLADELRADPGLIKTFVEEVLRIMSPIQGLFRRVTENVEIRGVAIPAGATVEIRWGAANRDPATYSDPARVDLHRANASSHLAFGAGPHLCIGNQLARGELRLAFRSIVERMGNLRLSRGEAGTAYSPLFISHGLTTLWIAFDGR